MMRKWKQVIVILGLLLFVIIINILNKKDYVASENASLYKEPLIVEYESETNPPINKLNIYEQAVLYQEEIFEQQQEKLKQEELDDILSKCNIYCDVSEIKFVDTNTQYTDYEKQLLAQCLYCEAGSTSWECQVITLSAILNHCDEYGGLWVLNSENHFAVAPYYQYVMPQEEQYKVVDYVLSGHRIADVVYFRIHTFHSFGTPMLYVDGVYFSK
nr:MAG TPA: Spore cortex-lytic enzyme, lytic transglycosylase [Caudoviricetes sp.]